MSKYENSTPCSRRSCTVFRENPQRGASGSPFMNSTTRSIAISARSRASSCSGVSSAPASAIGASPYAFSDGAAGARSVLDSAVGGACACFAMSAVSRAASAPSIRERSVWPYPFTETSMMEVKIAWTETEKRKTRQCLPSSSMHTHTQSAKEKGGVE